MPVKNDPERTRREWALMSGGIAAPPDPVPVRIEPTAAERERAPVPVMLAGADPLRVLRAAHDPYNGFVGVYQWAR
jgi:hypothetical protein